MDFKELGQLVGVIITFILLIPIFFSILSLNSKVTEDPGNPDNINHLTDTLTNSIIPWWLGIFEWLAGVPGIIGSILVVGFIFFLKWIGEVK